ncbi:MAG: CNNM domain-containing protein [Planctomycetota bacterium]|jgi:CBS domain containing-hemolysin-like protein
MSVIELAFFGVLVIVGVSLSALYSGLETGIYTINRVRLVVLANRHDRAAKRLQLETDRPNRLLGTLLVGNNVANYMGTYGVAAILDSLAFTPGQAIVINAGLLVPLLFVFGETLPKDLFRTHTDRWTYRLSGVLVLSRWLFTACGLLPVVRATGAVAGRVLGTAPDAAASARQHISQLIKEGVGVGVLSEAQTTLADRALALRDRTVSAEMVPWRAGRSV